jgi:hypothetical protein
VDTLLADFWRDVDKVEKLMEIVTIEVASREKINRRVRRVPTSPCESVDAMFWPAGRMDGQVRHL